MISEKSFKFIKFALIMEIERLKKQQILNKNMIVNKIDGSVRKGLEKALKEVGKLELQEIKKRGK